MGCPYLEAHIRGNRGWSKGQLSYSYIDRCVLYKQILYRENGTIIKCTKCRLDELKGEINE